MLKKYIALFMLITLLVAPLGVKAEENEETEVPEAEAEEIEETPGKVDEALEKLEKTVDLMERALNVFSRTVSALKRAWNSVKGWFSRIPESRPAIFLKGVLAAFMEVFEWVADIIRGFLAPFKNSSSLEQV